MREMRGRGEGEARKRHARGGGASETCARERKRCDTSLSLSCNTSLSLSCLSLATPVSPCASVVHASPDLTCVLCAVAGRCSRRGRRPVGYMYTPMVPCMAACLSWWLQCLAIRHAARCACSRLPAVAYVLASFSWHAKQVLYT